MAISRPDRSGLLCGGGGFRPLGAESLLEGSRLAADGARILVTGVLLRLIRVYQVTLSPWVGRQCRFHPTCSHYALEAIARHGPIAGSGLAIRRLLKCHPFHPGGVDLPPGSGE